MTYIDQFMGMRDADSGEDAEVASAVLEQRLAGTRVRIAELPVGHTAYDKALLQLEAARILVDLQRGEEAWDDAREAFDALAGSEDWENAVAACDVMVQTDHPDNLIALGNGVWLAVTFPIDPELTIAMLHHIVEETPDDSDGAAVAAAAAHYVAGLRCEGKHRDDLMFFTGNTLGTVARRHSGVNGQEQFDAWVKRLELESPEAFLPRLRNVVDVLVQDDWWVDRDAIWARLPQD
jgi:hypothetical protein